MQEDPELDAFLCSLDINDVARKRVLAEGYTLHEMIYHVVREDIRRIGLKGSSEIRIWRALKQKREGYSNGIN